MPQTNPLTEAAIDKLAAFLTGQHVSIQSAWLAVGGASGNRANEFFALRAAFDVTGHCSAEEAKSHILVRLGMTGA